MQGGSTRRDLLRRLAIVSGLPLGFLLGGGMLAAVLAALAVLARPLADAGSPTRAAVLIVAVALLSLGDVWAARRDRLYPVGLRRQARQVLMFEWRRPWAIGLVWGADAGLSLGTYRVTSGLWVLAAFVLTGFASPWTALVYAGGFVAGFLALVLWSARGFGPTPTAGAAQRRVNHATRGRRVAQLVYLWLLPPAVATAALGAWP